MPQNETVLGCIAPSWYKGLSNCEAILWHYRGGTVRVTGVKYNTKQLVVQARLAWVGAMQVSPLLSFDSWHNFFSNGQVCNAKNTLTLDNRSPCKHPVLLQAQMTSALVTDLFRARGCLAST